MRCCSDVGGANTSNGGLKTWKTHHNGCGVREFLPKLATRPSPPNSPRIKLDLLLRSYWRHHNIYATHQLHRLSGLVQCPCHENSFKNTPKYRRYPLNPNSQGMRASARLRRRACGRSVSPASGECTAPVALGTRTY